MVDTTLVITLTLSALATYLLLFTPVGGMVMDELNQRGINFDSQYQEQTTFEFTGDINDLPYEKCIELGFSDCK